MDGYEMWSLALQGAALFVVIISAWTVVRQLREMAAQTGHLRHAVGMSAETALDGVFVPVTQAYLANPELRSVFNPREEPPREMDRHTRLQACAVAELLADSMEKSLRFPAAGFSDPDHLRAWIKDSLRDSTFYRSWLLDHRHWYHESLVALAEEAARDVDGNHDPST